MRVAIITGAGSGIGLETAFVLARSGFAIVGVGRDPAKLALLGKQIPSEQLAMVAADLTDDAAPANIVAVALERWGCVDVIVNNAGIGRPKPVDETDDPTLDYVLGLMLRAPFRLIREALPHLKAGSAIINVTSTFALVGGLRGGAYSAAKAGLTGLTQHIAAQYGPRGIRCNAVAPGVVETPMTTGRFDEPVFQKMNQHMTPYPRLAGVADIAGTIAFLASPSGEMINGQTIVVDGGWTSTRYLSEFGRSSNWVAQVE